MTSTISEKKKRFSINDFNEKKKVNNFKKFKKLVLEYCIPTSQKQVCGYVNKILAKISDKSCFDARSIKK